MGNDDTNSIKGATKKGGKAKEEEGSGAKSDEEDVGDVEGPVSPSKSTASFSDEDEVPLSKLIPLVKADRRLSLENAAASAAAAALR